MMVSATQSTQLRVLVVDDEPLAREGLRMLLAEQTEIGEILLANNGCEAIAMIRAAQPDVVFLDVQMPEMDGFGVVQDIGIANMPAVVFVTAHDQYAIQAFEMNAIDYLLKPVTRERFAEALRRARSRWLMATQDNERVLSLLETLAPPRKYTSRLAIRSAGKTYFIEIQDVDWIQAAENYVQIHTGSTRHLVHVTIQMLQSALDPERFLRIHRSLIVNVQRVKEIKPAEHGEYVFVLANGERLQSGRTYNEAIRRWASNPF